MQPRFTVSVLVLQAEGLVSTIRYLGFLFQMTPAGVVAKPQEVAVLIGHLAWDTDLAAVEVVVCWRFSPSSVVQLRTCTKSS